MGYLLLFAASVWLFVLGIVRLKGPVSVTYLYPGSILKGANYLALPGSLTLFMGLLAVLPFIPDEWKNTLIIGGLLVFILSFYPAFKYLKPEWLRWLERNHKEILPNLEMEIRRIGLDVWDKQINTQAELEAWVNEYRKRHVL